MNRCYFGDVMQVLPQLAAEGVVAQTCVTSPPYWGLRDYSVPSTDWPEVTFIPLAGLPPVTVPAWHGCLGLEPDPLMFTGHLVAVFRRLWDVLADDGALWINLGDSYNTDGRKGRAQMGQGKNSGYSAWANKTAPGTKPKDLIGIPWRTAFALQADGWYLRQDVIWQKPNPMPESTRDRCTKAHEYLFLLSKSPRYYFDQQAIKEPAQFWSGRAATFDRGGNPVAGYVIPGQSAAQHRARSGNKERKAATDRGVPTDAEGKPTGALAGSVPWEGSTANKRSVWTVSTRPYQGAHFAVFPPRLIEPCILAGSRPGDLVLDPFFGSGTTGEVAQRLGRKWVGVELNAAYQALQEERTRVMGLGL